MTPNELAIAAMQSAPSERQAYLQSAAAGDAALLSEARTLLAQYERDPASQPTVVASYDHPSASAGPFQPGDLVAGRFRIARKLAEGGMGVVYQAIDEKLSELRAIKYAKAPYLQHLSPEARNSLRITHPNVCRVFEIHTTSTPGGDIDFLSMEFIDGETLLQRLRRDGPLPPQIALEVALQVCAAVAAAHGMNLLHRDLKSNNLMLSKDSQGKTPGRRHGLRPRSGFGRACRWTSMEWNGRHPALSRARALARRPGLHRLRYLRSWHRLP